MPLIVDPVSSHHFLIKEGKGFEIYSVGRDLNDDKGTPFYQYRYPWDLMLIPFKPKQGH